MSQQLTVSSLFSAAALAALCAVTAVHNAAGSDQAPGALVTGPAPIISAQIN